MTQREIEGALSHPVGAGYGLLRRVADAVLSEAGLAPYADPRHIIDALGRSISQEFERPHGQLAVYERETVRCYWQPGRELWGLYAHLGVAVMALRDRGIDPCWSAVVRLAGMIACPSRPGLTEADELELQAYAPRWFVLAYQAYRRAYGSSDEVETDGGRLSGTYVALPQRLQLRQI